MCKIQQHYIQYAERFAVTTNTHIWLGGSFLFDTATKYSDIDVSVFCNDMQTIKSFIYSYGNPVYISYTSNPPGILIVIYEDGVAVDLEIIEEINLHDSLYFHKDDVKNYSYKRNIKGYWI